MPFRQSVLASLLRAWVPVAAGCIQNISPNEAPRWRGRRAKAFLQGRRFVPLGAFPGA
jgi:hypothetical protein